MPVENAVTFPLEFYYGLNTFASRASLDLGFSPDIDDFHDIDLSVPGVAQTRGGNDTINDNICVFGTGSGEFDGDGDYLSVPDHANFDFSSGTWTVEGRFRVTSLASKNVIYFQGTDANNYMEIYVHTDGSVVVTVVSGGAAVVTVATAAGRITAGTWYEIACVENGDNWYIFIDGVDRTSSGSPDTSRAANYTGVVRIGANQFITAAYFNGFMDELRVSNSARYTAGYTPATAIFSSDANTMLLLHFEGDDQDTTFTDSGATTHTVTANGGAKLKVGTLTFTPKRLFDYYRPSVDTHRIIGNGGTKVFTMDHVGRWKTIGTGFTDGKIFDFVNLSGKCYMGNGYEEGKVSDDGTATRKWGITKPAAAPTVAVGVAGLLTGAYQYAFTYYNNTTGHESTRCAVSSTVNPAGQKVDLSVMAASSDAQVTHKRIYRTTNGGSTFLLLTTITNATTTYTDNTADADLGDTEAPEFNDPPPDEPWILEEWDGRLWFVAINSTVLYFSNDEFYTPTDNGLSEESFHPDNRIDFKAKIFSIRKSPNFNELWVHTSNGIRAVKPTGVPEDPYEPVLRNASWYSTSHYTTKNIYNDQWFQAQNMKVISLDSAGGVNYESQLIEPTLLASNKTLLGSNQACHYRGNGKNQYRLMFPESGQSTPNVMIAANYLNRTPGDARGITYATMEYHNIPTTCMESVINDDGDEVLYTGNTDGKIRKQDTGTNDDGSAIDWSMSVGWAYAKSIPAKGFLPRWLRSYFNPLGDWPFSNRMDYDFGKYGGNVNSITARPEGDRFDIDLVFDTSVFAPEDPLVSRDIDLQGHFVYAKSTWYGSTLDEVMEMHQTFIIAFQLEGARLHESRNPSS